MIDVTVKTLDSQNHSFSLNDDITVRQFKEHIAETVNISADLQRLIYCGRVLKDEKLLNEYDVNGKVIHLVQRVPPSQRSSNSPQSQRQNGNQRSDWSGPSPRIHYRQTQFHGNPMYVGSVSFPSDILESNEFPLQSVDVHASVIRRMLTKANRVIDRLDNPSKAEDTSESDRGAEASVDSNQAGEQPENASLNASNEESSSSAASSSSESRDNSSDALVPQVLATLLENLLSTQDRLRPYITNRLLKSPQLNNDSPSTSASEPKPETSAEENQRILDGVNECFHLLSHAQHALSNLNINMQQSPPRTLRCRSVVVQPSAILQAGLPIQVEAHISLQSENNGDSDDVSTRLSSTTRPETTINTSTTTTTSSSTASSQSSSEATSNTDRSTRSGSAPPSGQNQSQSSGDRRSESPFGNLFNFGNNVEVVMEMGPQPPRMWSFSSNDTNNGNGRVWSFGQSSDQNQTSTNNNNNNNNNNNTNNNNNNNNSSSNNARSDSTNGNGSGIGGVGGTSIPVGGATWGGTLSPDIIRNLMQAVAGYMVQSTGGSPPSSSSTSSTPATTSSTQTSSSSSTSTPPVTATATATPIGCVIGRTMAFAVGEPNSASGQSSTAGQNSQTRGNTETHPTTSTQTRTTSRTHVFQQHAQALGVGLSQSDFDPLLPCNSYHFRRSQSNNTNTATSAPHRSRQTNSSSGNQGSTLSQTAATIISPRSGLITTISGVPIFDSQNANPLSTVINNARRQNDRAISFNSVLLSRGINLNSEGAERSIFRPIYAALSRLPVSVWFSIKNGVYTQIPSSIITSLYQGLNTYLSDSLTREEFPNALADEFIREIEPYLRRSFANETINILNDRRISIVKTLVMIIRSYIEKLGQLIASEPDSSSIPQLVKIIQDFGRDIVSVLRLSLPSGAVGIKRILTRFASDLTSGFPQAFREWVLGSVVPWFYVYSNSATRVPQSVAELLIIYEESNKSSEATSSSEASANESSIKVEPMEVDVPNERAAANPLLLDDNEEIPTSFPGHENLLSSWVPIIARDGVRQRRQLELGLTDNNVTTLSDAYLSTMPNKRRKLVEQQKPTILTNSSSSHSAIPASMERLVRESVNRTGYEEVDGAISALVADSSVRRAFGQVIRESLNPRRFQTPDFPDPLRFPNATKFFDIPPK